MDPVDSLHLPSLARLMGGVRPLVMPAAVRQIPGPALVPGKETARPPASMAVARLMNRDAARHPTALFNAHSPL